MLGKRFDEQERAASEALRHLEAARDECTRGLEETQNEAETARRELADLGAQLGAAGEATDGVRLALECAHRERVEALEQVDALERDRTRLRELLNAEQAVQEETGRLQRSLEAARERADSEGRRADELDEQLRRQRRDVEALKAAVEREAATQRAQIAELEAALVTAVEGRDRAVRDAEALQSGLERELFEARAALHATVGCGDRLGQESRPDVDEERMGRDQLEAAQQRVSELEERLVVSERTVAQIRGQLRGLGIHLL